MIHQATRLISDAFKEAGLKCGIQELGLCRLLKQGLPAKITFKLRFIASDDGNDVKAMTEKTLPKYPESKFPRWMQNNE